MTEEKQELAKPLETEALATRDVADDEEIVRHMTTEDLANDSPHTRALAIIQASQQASPVEQLAFGAFLDLLDTDSLQVVREDDGSVWMFVPGDPEPDRWRGALRERNGVIERSWFVPSEGKIVWYPAYPPPRVDAG